MPERINLSGVHAVEAGDGDANVDANPEAGAAPGKPVGQVYITVPVSNGGKRTSLTMMVDTGSEISIVSPKQVKKLTGVITCKLTPDDSSQITLADGSSSLAVTGVVWLWLKFKHVEVQHRFLVAEVDSPAIIGGDFTGVAPL